MWPFTSDDSNNEAKQLAIDNAMRDADISMIDSCVSTLNQLQSNCNASLAEFNQLLFSVITLHKLMNKTNRLQITLDNDRNLMLVCSCNDLRLERVNEMSKYRFDEQYQRLYVYSPSYDAYVFAMHTHDMSESEAIAEYERKCNDDFNNEGENYE